MDNINPQAQDTIISETIEVTAKEGDTVDTVDIKVTRAKEELVTIEIGALKQLLVEAEADKKQAVNNLALMTSKVDALVAEIAKYTPEAEAGINSARAQAEASSVNT